MRWPYEMALSMIRIVLSRRDMIEIAYVELHQLSPIEAPVQSLFDTLASCFRFFILIVDSILHLIV